jgi:ATP synthase protein I
VTADRHRRDQRFAGRVGQRERRKLHARRQAGRDLWFGLGMYGLVGWSVAAPTVLGVALGVWLDARYPSRFSWTLMLLAAGLLVGCWTAWYWVAREQRAIGDASSGAEDQAGGEPGAGSGRPVRREEGEHG